MEGCASHWLQKRKPWVSAGNELRKLMLGTGRMKGERVQRGWRVASQGRRLWADWGS